MVKLMFAVVTKVHPSVRSAYLDSFEELMTSLTAVYAKLQGIEPEVCRGFVLYAHDRLEPILKSLDGGTLPPPLPGYPTRILDGNHLAGTEHRLAPTAPPASRRVAAGAGLGRARPGHDAGPRRGARRGCGCSGAIVDRRGPGTRRPGRLLDRRSELLLQSIRLRHGPTPGPLPGPPAQGDPALEEAGAWTELGRIDTGVVFEQTIRVTDIEERDGVVRDEQGQARTVTIRRIRLVLDQPTEDGETEIFLVSDVPAAKADGRRLATIYRRRWTLENVFQRLSEALRCEIDTLAYPKAALFGFCTALVAYDVVAAVRAALRSARGAKQVEGKVWNYHVVGEVARTYEGMMIALPPQEWAIFRAASVEEFAEFLQVAAELARLAKYPLSRRGPNKPRPKQTSGKRNHHVATVRLLDQQNRHNR